MPKSWKIGTIGTFLMSYDIVECMLLAKTGINTYFQKLSKKSLQKFVKNVAKLTETNLVIIFFLADFQITYYCWTKESTAEGNTYFVSTKGIEFCNKSQFSNTKISTTKLLRPLIFQTLIVWYNRSHSLKSFLNHKIIDKSELSR